MKVKVRDSKPEEGQPEVIEMFSVDARHAIAADPERYSFASDDDARLNGISKPDPVPDPVPEPAPEPEEEYEDGE